jgi:hypothetical protein
MRKIRVYSDGCQCFWSRLKVIYTSKLVAMNTVLSPEIREVMETVHYLPAISIILPFEPKMSLKRELLHRLEMSAKKVEQELLINYPNEMGKLVMLKLKTIINNLNFNTFKKSIAIYVSPVFEKVLYLDIAVEERIIVDESFEIRDLVYSKKQMHKYLLLQLSGNQSRIYIGNSVSFVKIVSNVPQTAASYVNDIAERVANFSDMAERKKILLDKFLRYIDNSLNIILHAYPLPLFVMGTERVLGHFKKLTQHSGKVIDYVQGNYEAASEPELIKILEPYVCDWKQVQQKDVVKKLEDAANKNKLAIGMRDVWREAVSLRGRLLVVEKNYMYAAQRGSNDEVIYKAIEPFNKFSYIKDAVDDVIEKVLENGGDVEFVDEGVLKDYHHIVLIQYY